MDPRQSNSKRRGEDSEEATKRAKYGASPASSRGATPTGEDDPLAFLNNLPSVPPATNIKRLNKSEVVELERVLEIDEWREDWCGNLALAEEDISNPNGNGSAKKSNSKQPLIVWALRNANYVRLLVNLLRFVLSMGQCPQTVKNILASVLDEPIDEIIAGIRRANYDPSVLSEDGWTITKAPNREGASGGAHLIGDRIRCENNDAVVIAYIHDADIGDLWKAIYLDDLASFDLEAEELLEAKRKYDRRVNGSTKNYRRSTRTNVATDSGFTVKGIEYGIVLAGSYAKGARPGVLWPARVMHPSESPTNTIRRSAAKSKIDLVFLSPYWKSDDFPRPRKVEGLSENGSEFDTSPLLQVETIDATADMIKEYNVVELDVSQLKMSFRFTGLPKSAFVRYLDAHRLAQALRTYAKDSFRSAKSSAEKATAGLFETHPMAVQAPKFPSVILHLPFSYILGKIRSETDRSPSSKESPILLSNIVQAMEAPYCWGETASPVPAEPSGPPVIGSWLKDTTTEANHEEQNSAIIGFVTAFPLLNKTFNKYTGSPALVGVLSSITRLLSTLGEEEEEAKNLADDKKLKKLESLVQSWVVVKKLGEESLAALVLDNPRPVVNEWRRAAEKIYDYMVKMYHKPATVVMTDTRCNQHRTDSGCLERNVRLPAALKGARLAGAGTTTRLIDVIDPTVLAKVEERVLLMAHTVKYLKRMKSRCEAAGVKEVVGLTDDSEGEGGEDTRGSRGTWEAAVVGVSAAVQAVDMVVRGQSINAFCVTRPPGHHAGRNLHPMKAVSNGFCILNPVACAALYAASSVAEGGLGLSRVCVIDFDVHHGNGTQDILCASYDPRFLYVSIHAGGAEINGHPTEDESELHTPGGNASVAAGIYPGRCGDTSPHKGVLNIPLGEKVMPQDVGAALLNDVAPRVESFAPDMILLSAGFDAHKSDPMGLGGLRAEDFGHITQVACELALKSCSGRVVSVLEGGYGVPCCRRQEDIFLPKSADEESKQEAGNKSDDEDDDDAMDVDRSAAEKGSQAKQRPQPSKLLDLGSDLPDDMDDQVPYALQTRLEKCHAEGFVECVEEHVKALINAGKTSA